MSLVRDALAKAEREAAARSAREKGLPASLSEFPQPYRARRRARWPWALSVVAATIAVVTALVALRPAADPGPQPALPSPAVTAGSAEAPTSAAESRSEAGTSPPAALDSAASPPPGESSPSYQPPTAPASSPATTVSDSAIDSTASAAGAEAPSTSAFESRATSPLAGRPYSGFQVFTTL